jgi:hypothetical protein
VYHGTLDALLRSSVEEEAWDCTSWKALRLKRKEFALLIRKTAVNAAFWIFQGNDIPLEGGLPGSSLELECSHKVPGKPAWQLSIYRKMPEPHCFT